MAFLQRWRAMNFLILLNNNFLINSNIIIVIEVIIIIIKVISVFLITFAGYSSNQLKILTLFPRSCASVFHAGSLGLVHLPLPVGVNLNFPKHLLAASKSKIIHNTSQLSDNTCRSQEWPRHWFPVIRLLCCFSRSPETAVC